MKHIEELVDRVVDGESPSSVLNEVSGTDLLKDPTSKFKRDKGADQDVIWRNSGFVTGQVYTLQSGKDFGDLRDGDQFKVLDHGGTASVPKIRILLLSGDAAGSTTELNLKRTNLMATGPNIAGVG